jgi:hypothetical protein
VNDFRERRLNRHQISRRESIGTPANERRLNRHDYSRREATPPNYAEFALITILGPCANYVPAEELEDSDFDIDFGGGCLGPSRFGLFLRNLDSGVISTVNLERTTGLTYDSYGCASSTKTVTAELVFSDLNTDGLLLSIIESASPISTFTNSIYRFDPLVGSYVQRQTSPCDCVTFPYDACIAPPTR